MTPDEFITQNLPVVEQVVAKYRPRLPSTFLTEDLIGAGRLGLVIASRTWQPSASPANYWARRMITREILKLVSDRNWMWATTRGAMPTSIPAALPAPEAPATPKLAAVQAAVANLPPVYRKLVELIYEHGIREYDIAGEGKSRKKLLAPGTGIKRIRRLHREALELVRKELERLGFAA